MGTPSHLLTQTVSFAAPGAVDQNGDPTFGTVQSIPCRHLKKVERASGPSGISLIELTVIVSEVEIPAGSLVWLDGTDAGDHSKARIPQVRTNAKKPFEAYTLYETRL